MNTTTNTEYSSLAKWLHWLVAGLIIIQYCLIAMAENAEEANQVVKQLGIIANHKSIGITILFLAIIRLTVRTRSTPPPLPTSMPIWQVKASHISHIALYVCLFALPISGWLMSSAKAYSVSWFNLISLPDFISADKQSAAILSDVHASLAGVLATLALLHVLAALKHHFIDKDSILTRMSGKASICGAALTMISLLVAFSGVLSNKQANTTSIEPSSNTQTTSAKLIESSLPVWNIDYENSHIKFTGEQAGAPFTGKWQEWTGKLQFNSEQLAKSRFDVEIDINSVFSNDDERDETILSADFFDVIKFPSAQFQAGNFSKIDTGFLAQGRLIIKGINQAVNFEFNTSQTGDKIKLIGNATLDRHTWNLGIGDWADPTWVSSEVSIEVQVSGTVNSK